MTMRVFTGSLMLMLLLAASCAGAQQPYVDIERRFTPEQLRETGLDGLTAAQLQALNRLLRGETSAVGAGSTAATVPAADPAAPVAGTAAAAPVPGSGSAGAARPIDDPGTAFNLIGLSDAVIKSRLVGTVSGWEPGTVFALANGQRWKVLKGSAKLRTPKESPEVLVVPGIAGRWFLQVDEAYPKARVYRID